MLGIGTFRFCLRLRLNEHTLAIIRSKGFFLIIIIICTIPFQIY